MVFLRQVFFTPPTLAPNIPTFNYATFTPTFELPIQNEQSATQQSANITLPASTITPLPFQPQISQITPTNRNTSGSSSSPSIPSSSSGGPSSIPQPTPIQAFAVTLTPNSSIPPPPAPPVGQSSSTPTVCGNILLPARPGNQWTYIFNTPSRKGDINLRILSINSNQAEVEIKDLSTGNISQSYAQCDQDTLLSFPQVGVQSMLSDSLGGSVKADYISGTLAPNESTWSASNWNLTWAMQYRIEGNISLTLQGTTTSVSILPSIVNIVCQAPAPGSTTFEAASTAAGTFNSLKTVCNASGPINVSFNGLAVAGSISAQSQQWFALNTGLLKSQTDFVNLSILGETIPVSAAAGSSIELRNFFINP